MSLEIRRMEPGDRAFVVSSWRDSFFAEHSSGPILDEHFDLAYLPTIDAILDAPTTTVLVAVFPDEAPPFDIVGYAVVEHRQHSHDKGRVICARPIVDFVYVREAFRGKGIARELMLAHQITLRRDPPPNPRGAFPATDKRSERRGARAPGPDTYCPTFRTRIGSAIVETHWHGGRFDPLVVRFMNAPPKVRKL